MMQRVFVCLSAAVVALAGGCMAGNGDESIIVLNDVHADGASNCDPIGALGVTSWTHGTLDLSLPSTYWFIAQLATRSTPEALTLPQKIQQTILTNGANVDISFPGSTLFSDAELAELRTAGLTHHYQPFGGTLPPGEHLTVKFELIPEQLVERIIAKAEVTSRFRLQAQATITVVGDMSGGSVSSQPFSFGITLGKGVVVKDIGRCSALAPGFKTATADAGYVCNPLQDGSVNCCTSDDPLVVVCPAVGPPILTP